MDRLIAVLQPRTSRVLTHDDVGPMSRNLLGFVATLLDWERGARARADVAPAGTGPPLEEAR